MPGQVKRDGHVTQAAAILGDWVEVHGERKQSQYPFHTLPTRTQHPNRPHPQHIDPPPAVQPVLLLRPRGAAGQAEPQEGEETGAAPTAGGGAVWHRANARGSYQGGQGMELAVGVPWPLPKSI